MDSSGNADYSRLYRVFVNRREEEFQKLDASVGSMAQLHADLLGLDMRYCTDETAKERITSGEAMHLLFELWEYFRETDLLLEKVQASIAKHSKAGPLI